MEKVINWRKRRMGAVSCFTKPLSSRCSHEYLLCVERAVHVKWRFMYTRTVCSKYLGMYPFARQLCLARKVEKRSVHEMSSVNGRTYNGAVLWSVYGRSWTGRLAQLCHSACFTLLSHKKSGDALRPCPPNKEIFLVRLLYVKRAANQSIYKSI